jgi:hypothetical protein
MFFQTMTKCALFFPNHIIGLRNQSLLTSNSCDTQNELNAIAKKTRDWKRLQNSIYNLI